MDTKSQVFEQELNLDITFDVEHKPKEATRLGIKLARSNRNRYDPIQIPKMDLVRTIAFELIQQGYYKYAFLVLKSLCNRAMGALKCEVAIDIAEVLVKGGQFRWVYKMGKLVAPLPGEAKSLVARNIAIFLAEANYHKQAQVIVDQLSQHNREYAREMVNGIFDRQDDITFDLDKKYDEAVALGVKCAKSNKTRYNPIQIRYMKAAHEIGLALIARGQYHDAILVAVPLCNIKMRDLKSKAAIAFSEALIEADQIEYALNIARMVSLLKGNAKVMTAKTIALGLVRYGAIKEAQQIVADLQKHTAEYAQNAGQEVVMAIEVAQQKAKTSEKDKTAPSVGLKVLNVSAMRGQFLKKEGFSKAQDGSVQSVSDSKVLENQRRIEIAQDHFKKLFYGIYEDHIESYCLIREDLSLSYKIKFDRKEVLFERVKEGSKKKYSYLFKDGSLTINHVSASHFLFPFYRFVQKSMKDLKENKATLFVKKK